MSENLPTSGVVKWFNQDKGYGFIQAEGMAKDVFLHVKSLRASGITNELVEGEHIRFVCNTGPRGYFATNISRNGATPPVKIGG
jgi:CspA family cold shock protein